MLQGLEGQSPESVPASLLKRVLQLSTGAEPVSADPEPLRLWRGGVSGDGGGGIGYASQSPSTPGSAGFLLLMIMQFN